MNELKATSSGEIRARDALLGYWWYEKSEADKVIKEYNNELRRQKYKRCLWLARWCASRSASWCLDPADDELHKSDFYDKWKLRWLELAEKFKETK